MSFYKQFRALPFKIHTSNPLRRITRKSAVADELNYFPPEGHVCLPINSYTYLYFGGARRGQESTWNLSNKLCRISFVIDDNDVSIENFSEIKLSGGQFPHLQSSAGFYIPPKNCLFVWGGLNLSSFSMLNELYVVNINDTKGVVEVIQPPGGISKRKFEGEIPSGRCGHSFTHLFDSCAILHGGVCFPHRNSCVGTSLFTNITNDSSFYMFDYESLFWTKLAVSGSNPRAYHTATVMDIRGMRSIVYIGGVIKTESDLRRIPLSNVFVLKMDSHRHFHTEILTFANSPAVGVSYHSAGVIGPYIFVVGGVDENNLQGRCSVSVLNVETFLCDNIQFDQSFKSAGHSVCKLSNDCLMICGGMHLQYFVYTSKPMVPSPCDFGNDCKIIESSEISPISWIQCEGLCKRWLHQFCVGVLDTDMSRRKFFCSTCSKSSRGKKRKLPV